MKLSLSRLILQLILPCCAISFAQNSLGEAADLGAIILQYHHVSDTAPSSTSISPARFRQHLDYLEQRQFQIWPLERLMEALSDAGQAQQDPLPNRLASITFDDAYDDIYSEAFPLLKEKKIPFTIFVATQFIGQANYLSWAQLGEMQAAGATIANHTHSHLHMMRRPDETSAGDWLLILTEEILTAEQLIEVHLGPGPKLFAYPYGEYNRTIQALVKALGYYGFGQQSGPAGFISNPQLYPRFPFSGPYSAIEGFKTKLNTRPMPATTSQPEPLTQLARPKLTLNFTSSDLDLSRLTCYGPGGRAELNQTSQVSIDVTAAADIPVGRSRYNCTLPLSAENAYYWLSQIWMKKHPDGSWYAEP